ncbi:MAG: RNA methyltransferase [Flavobacteriales bacterium]|nr:RNA methyltransferase [Flavobacteriales bacterium]
MITKNEIKLFRALRNKKHRDQEGLFVVEGLKVLLEIKASGLEVIKIFTTIPIDSLIADPQVDISLKELKQVSSFVSPHEMIALVRKPEKREKLEQKGLIIGLDNIQDPGNLGTILRSADWFGVEGIMCSHDTVDLYNPKVIQASMGGIARQRVDFVDLLPRLKELKSTHRIFGASLTGSNVYELQWPENSVLLIGNEASGLGDKFDAVVDEYITIPNFGSLDSLNAAIACSILCSEYKRQH